MAPQEKYHTKPNSPIHKFNSMQETPKKGKLLSDFGTTSSCRNSVANQEYQLMPNSSITSDESYLENTIKTVSTKMTLNSEHSMSKDSKHSSILTINTQSNSLCSDIQIEPFLTGKTKSNYLRNPSPSMSTKKIRGSEDMTAYGNDKIFLENFNYFDRRIFESIRE